MVARSRRLDWKSGTGKAGGRRVRSRRRDQPYSGRRAVDCRRDEARPDRGWQPDRSSNSLMSLASKPLTELLEEFRSSSPTPGGGSASALAGALGASLLAMIAALPRPRASADNELRELKDAGDRATTL